MEDWFETAGWLACVVYATIPSFWLMVHPFAEHWRSKRRSPYLILVPVWISMWIVVAIATSRWRHVALYRAGWNWILGAILFVAGLYLYSRSSKNFSAKQLGGLPEVHARNREQRLVTDGIRARVRHPVYLAHLCEMLAWSIGTGLAVCWGLTAFAIVTGAIMIRLEDAELEKRFGESYRTYRDSVPAVVPKSISVQPPRLSCDGVFLRYETEGAQVWQIAISDLICFAEYTTAKGPLSEDYLLVFVLKDCSYYEASFYADGRDPMLDILGASLGCPLRPGLAHSTVFASRVVWPLELEGQPLFSGNQKADVNPAVTQLAGPSQL